MKNLARLSSLVAAISVCLPATGFGKDHGGSSQGGNFQGNSQGNHGTFQGNHPAFQGSHGNWLAGNHGNWQAGSHGDWHSGHGDWHNHGDWHGHGDWHDHGDWHHHHFHGPLFGFYGSYYPYYSYPYYSTPYYDGDYYDDYYGGPSVGFTITHSPSYRNGDNLAVDVQRALRRDGYYHGSVDGDVGPGTRGAIRQYQYDRGLEVTGRIDRALLRSLGLD